MNGNYIWTGEVPRSVTEDKFRRACEHVAMMERFEGLFGKHDAAWLRGQVGVKSRADEWVCGKLAMLTGTEALAWAFTGPDVRKYMFCGWLFFDAYGQDAYSRKFWDAFEFLAKRSGEGRDALKDYVLPGDGAADPADALVEAMAGAMGLDGREVDRLYESVGMALMVLGWFLLRFESHLVEY